MHLIEASAGTGKTYHIQNIYARLVMETDFRVADILVMTFTEAATGELRDRLRAILTDLQRRLDPEKRDCDGTDPEDVRKRNERADKLIRCAESADDATKRLRVELALVEFDNAAISTIHGFCGRVLARYAFEIGTPFVQKIGSDKKAELSARAEDWWRKNGRAVADKFDLRKLKLVIEKLSGKTDYAVAGTGECLTVAQEIIDRYESERLERESLSFDDLLRILRDALRSGGGRELAKKLHREYKAALVDEFQDTDPVQYEIFEKIFLDDEENVGPLFLVGDPKQAIYGFRGGDIYTYFRAAAVRGLNRHTLTENHRSTRRMMSAVNALFGDGKAAGSTFGYENIAYNYVDVPADAPADDGTGEAALRIVEFDASQVADRYWADITDQTVRRIAEVLREKSADGVKTRFSPRDIAILMNSKSRMRNLQRALSQAGIPSVIQDLGNVFESSVAIELLVFLTAVADVGVDGSDREVRAALLTVFGGVAPADSARELDDTGRFAEHVAWLKELKGIWHTRGFSALVSVMERRGYLLRLAEMPDGERRLSDLGQILELCCAAGKEVGPLPEDLINWLKTRISSTESERDADAYQRELETDGDAVRITTIHVSKGLQYPVVFLPDCWNVNSRHDQRNNWGGNVFHYHDENDRLVFSDSDAVRNSANLERKKERTRLLYVALTRAKYRTILFTPNLEASAMRNEPLRDLLVNLTGSGNGGASWIWSPMDHSIDARYSARAADGDGGGLKVFSPRKFDDAPLKGSYSLLSPSHAANGDGDEDRDCDDNDPWIVGEARDAECEHAVFALPGGARLGTCWHNIFEKLAFDADAETIERLVRGELAESGFSDAFAPTLDMVNKTLDHPLHSPDGDTFRLRDIPWKDRLSEQEFDFSSAGAVGSTGDLREILGRHWAGDAAKRRFVDRMAKWDRDIPRGFMTGFVDLIFRRGDFYYIVDWKSNSLNRKKSGFSADGIREEMARHGYFFQYMLYAAVLHRHLETALGGGYSWEKCFGGIRYCFLRGIAAGGDDPVFADRPDKALLDEFSEALGIGRYIG